MKYGRLVVIGNGEETKAADSAGFADVNVGTKENLMHTILNPVNQKAADV